MNAAEPTFYVAGGTLHHDAPSYVERQADKTLWDGLLTGEFCYVLTSRQMGKSSLMVRTTRKLREQSRKAAVLDLTAIGQNLTPEQWYDGLITKLSQQLDLEDEVFDFWSANPQWGPLQRWMMALEKVILPRCDTSLVIFIDEIDVVRSLPFVTDEFFAAIRECYNRRPHDPKFNQVTFCLLGVATPSDLIRDPRTTPFNIGLRIELSDFTTEEAAPLALGLDKPKPGAEQSESLLQRILHWTRGHPYLTQRLCRAVAQELSGNGEMGNRETTDTSPTTRKFTDSDPSALVDRLCEELFLSNRARERDDNLLYVRERLLRTEADLGGLLKFYNEIWSGRTVRDDETNLFTNQLRLAGAVRAEKGILLVRNAIYERVFDAQWIQAQLPASGSEGVRLEQFRSKHQVGLLTLLQAQVADATKLGAEMGEAEGSALLQRFQAIVHELLRQHDDADQVQSTTDSFFLVFSKPADAVRFSLGLQSQLRVLARETSDAVMARIGIHIGDAAADESLDLSDPQEIYGLQADVCGQLMSLAAGNQILLTRSAFDHARQALKRQDIAGATNVSWINHGLYQCADLDEPIEVCEVGERAHALLRAPPDSPMAKRQTGTGTEPVLGWRPGRGEPIPRTSWILEAKLGEGGFGEVWLGHDKTHKHKRRVFKFCFRADRARSLKREATLFQVLKERVGEHPHIVGIQDVFLDRPPYHIAMDYVEGRDLRSWWDVMGGHKKIPLGTRLEIVAQVADALHAAHRVGVLHRDIKPSNILVTSKGTGQNEVQVKLTDFGIGQVVSKEVLSGMKGLGFTQTMMLPGGSLQAGTYIYMAPELLGGMPAVPQSDIYSLGVVLYQLVLGDLARPVTMDWIVEDPVLRETIKKCFASDPQERFATGEHLAHQLRTLEKRRALNSKKAADTVAQQRASAAFRHRFLTTAGIILLCSAGVLIAILVIWLSLF